MAKIDVLSLLPEELEAFALEIGEKKFRGKQIFEGLYHGATEFSQITNLPKSLIAKLEEGAEIRRMTTERKLVSKLDGTVKFLFGLQDGFVMYNGTDTTTSRILDKDFQPKPVFERLERIMENTYKNRE